MKKSNPLLLFPIRHPKTYQNAPLPDLSNKQTKLLDLIDGHTSIAELAILQGSSPESCQEEIELFVQKGYVMLSHQAIERKPRRRHTTPPEKREPSTNTAEPPGAREWIPESSEELSSAHESEQEETLPSDQLSKSAKALQEKAAKTATGEPGQESPRTKTNPTDESQRTPTIPTPKIQSKSTEKTQKMPTINEEITLQTPKPPTLQKEHTLSTPKVSMSDLAQTQQMPTMNFHQDLGETQPDMAFPDISPDILNNTPFSNPPSYGASSLPATQAGQVFPETSDKHSIRQKTITDRHPVPPYPSSKFTTKRLSREALEELMRKPIPGESSTHSASLKETQEEDGVEKS